MVQYTNLVNFSYDEKTHIITTPDLNYVPKSKGIGWLLYEKMKENATKVFQIEAESGETELYSSFLQRSIRTAIEMQKYDIKPNDIISIYSANNMNNAVPFVAATFLGAVVGYIDATLNYDDALFVVTDLRPKICFVEKNFEKDFVQIAKTLKLDVKIVIFEENFAEFTEPKPSESKFEPYPIENLGDTAVVLFSSGTTGMPKGICLSHNYLLSVLLVPVNGPTLFTTGPLHGISGTTTLMLTVNNGLRRLFCRQNVDEKFWNYAEKYEVSVASFAKRIKYLLDCSPKKPLPHLKYICLGGTHIPNKTLQDYIKSFPDTQIIHHYGQTEQINVFYGLTPYEKFPSVGRPLIGCSYKIVDPETGKNLGPNQPGELRVKSKIAMSGYYKRDDSNVWDSDGFLGTGDIAYFDEDFYFYIVDRLKEMFKFRCLHYVPAKVEMILCEHPDVERAVVIGIPHPTDDNHAMAVIQRKESSNVTENEIEKFINSKVDEFHQIRAGVKFVENMPETALGKINRRLLRKMLENETK